MTPVTLSVFGKHPAWSDHLPALGEVGSALTEFQQAFYNRGIGESLAQGRWGSIGQGGEPVPWNHWIWSVGPAGCVLALCTASSDAKGRKQYPLVTALSGPDIQALANPNACGAHLRRVSTAVAEALDEAAAVQAFSSLDSLPPPASVPRPDRTAFLRECGGGEGPAVSRVLHALSIHGAGYGNARVRTASRTDDLLWLSLIRHLLEEESGEMTLISGEGSSMADIFLHPPESGSLGFLFTDSVARPLSQDISYRLAEGWETVCRENATGWAGQETLLENAPSGKKAEEGKWPLLTRLMASVFQRRSKD